MAHANTCGRYGSTKSENTIRVRATSAEQFDGILSIQLTVEMIKIEMQTDPILYYWHQCAAAEQRKNDHLANYINYLYYYYYYSLFVRRCAWQSSINIIHSFIAVRSWWHQIDMEHHLRASGVWRATRILALSWSKIHFHANKMWARLDLYL